MKDVFSDDFNDAPEQRDFSDLIPKGTIASIRITVRPGGAGDGGWLKRSKDGGCEMLDLEFVLVDGEYARRKFWANMVIAGTTDGHSKAAEINRSRLRAILESARGIKPDDTSAEAREKRKASIADFDGLTFIGKVGIEPGTPRGNGEDGISSSRRRARKHRLATKPLWFQSRSRRGRHEQAQALATLDLRH